MPFSKIIDLSRAKDVITYATMDLQYVDNKT